MKYRPLKRDMHMRCTIGRIYILAVIDRMLHM